CLRVWRTRSRSRHGFKPLAVLVFINKLKLCTTSLSVDRGRASRHVSSLRAAKFALRHATLFCQRIDIPAIVARIGGEGVGQILLPPLGPRAGLGRTIRNIALQQAPPTGRRSLVIGVHCRDRLIEELGLVEGHPERL